MNGQNTYYLYPEIYLPPHCKDCHSDIDEDLCWVNDSAAHSDCDWCGRAPVRYVIDKRQRCNGQTT